MRYYIKVLGILGLMAVSGSPVWAQQEPHKETNRDLETLIHRLDVQKKRIEAFERELDRRQSGEPPIRAARFEADLPDFRRERRDPIIDPAVPGWITRDLELQADVTVGYFASFPDDHAYRGNPRRRVPALDPEHQHTAIYAVHLGATKRLSDEWMAGFRLATTQGDATDQFVTAGAYWQEQPVGIDRAWIAWRPKAVEGIEIVAGKFENPFVTTSMIWDDEISPEGVAESWRPEVDGPWKPFVTLAQLIAEEQARGTDIACLAWQTGFDWRVRDDVNWRLAATFYDWHGFDDAPRRGLDGAPPPAAVFPAGSQTTLYGNTVVLRRNAAGAFDVYYDTGGFDIVNITTMLSFEVPVGDRTIPVEPFFDIAWNEHDDTIGGHHDTNDAHSVGVRVGSIDKPGDMEFYYKYARIEANAVLGRFADADFGFANRQGHALSLGYRVNDGVSIVGSLWMTKPIYDPFHTETLTPSVELDVVFEY